MAVNLEPLRSGDPSGVGRYQFLGRLGAGGMGLVCLGRSPEGRLVAVKLIHEDIAADPDYRRRFAREVSAASRIIGRFTAALVDADPSAVQPWYAAEYIEGPTLKQVVRYSGPLDEPALRALAGGLADAVAAIAAAGLVHRDVKPDNILLAADGPKVIDFGIARGDNDSLLTNAGSVLGSPGYMSPEQVAGVRAETPSDVFSLGAVLTFAGQGVGPFGDGPPQSRMYLTRYGEPDCSGVPLGIRPLVLRCLAREPRDRPPVGELVRSWSVDAAELDTLIHAQERPEAGVDLGATQPARAADLGLGEDAASGEPWRPAKDPADSPGDPGSGRAAGARTCAAREPGFGPLDVDPAKVEEGTHVTERMEGEGRELRPLVGQMAPRMFPPSPSPSPIPSPIPSPHPNQYPSPNLTPGPSAQAPPQMPLLLPPGPPPQALAPIQLDSRRATMPAAGAAEFAPRPPERSPFVARDWTGNVPVPSSSQGSVPAASSPWWHQPVLADLLPGGRIRDLCAVVLAFGLLAAFRVPTTSSVALHIAEVSVVLFLGLTLGFRRGGLALVAYGAAALGGVKILPGQVSATVRDLTFGYLLQLATLLLFAAAAARLGGVGKRPVLGFVVAFAACVAGEGVAVAWTAHLLSGISFLTLWRQTEGVAAVYRDAGISAVCSVGLAFGGMWLATRRAGPGA